MRGGFIRISQTGDISENVFFFVYLFLMIRLREEINMNNVEERRRHYNISHFSMSDVTHEIVQFESSLWQREMKWQHR